MEKELKGYDLFFDGFRLKVEPKSKQITCHILEINKATLYFEKTYDISINTKATDNEKRLLIKGIPDHVLAYEFKKQYGYTIPFHEKVGMLTNLFEFLGAIVRMLRP